MRPYQSLILLILVFTTVQLLGLYTGLSYAAAIKAGVAQPVVENPQAVSNSLVIFGYIIIITVIVLLIIRFRIKLLLVLEAMAIFFASGFVFDFLFPYALAGFPVSILLAGGLTIWKLLRPSILSQNIALIFAVSGAGALLGASLDVLPVLVFMLILSAYDFVSVFITRHMIYMAKAMVKRPMAFTAAFPTEYKKAVRTISGRRVKARVFQLGGGDLAIPLMFTVSIAVYIGVEKALFAFGGALIAALLLFAYIMHRPGLALPALPPICAGACAGFWLGVIL